MNINIEGDSKNNKIVTKQEWISVEDRLPEEAVPVLVKVENKDVLFQAHITHHLKPNIWVIEGYSRTVWQDRVSFYVTHWMPLPNPPK